MGFKCPLCKKDFGNDKRSWENHIRRCNGDNLPESNNTSISMAKCFVDITTSVESLPKQSESFNEKKRKSKGNRKIHKLIDITCSVPQIDVLENSAVFKADLMEDKHNAIIAMAKSLRILSKNTIYEAEILQLLCRCSAILDFTAEEINKE